MPPTTRVLNIRLIGMATLKAALPTTGAEQQSSWSSGCGRPNSWPNSSGNGTSF